MSAMKIAVCQHVANEPLGYFESFLLEKGIPFEYIRLYETNELPRTDATHFIFLGGPMSVNDEREYPWLRKEKDLIRNEVRKQHRVLGICLGAQLIASAFGAPVYRYVKETGWQLLNKISSASGVFAGFPDRFHVFQLHGETFEIPYGGRRLCTGNVVKNQAFRYKTALGMQFHLELTYKIIDEWSHGLSRHARSQVARDTPRYLNESNRLCRIIAENFTGAATAW
jgi:GMP synthase-like glutamine amidotransferase